MKAIFKAGSTKLGQSDNPVDIAEYCAVMEICLLAYQTKNFSQYTNGDTNYIEFGSVFCLDTLEKVLQERLIDDPAAGLRLLEPMLGFFMDRKICERAKTAFEQLCNKAVADNDSSLFERLDNFSRAVDFRHFDDLRAKLVRTCKDYTDTSKNAQPQSHVALVFLEAVDAAREAARLARQTILDRAVLIAQQDQGLPFWARSGYRVSSSRPGD